MVIPLGSVDLALVLQNHRQSHPLLGIVHFSAGYVIVQVLTYHLMYLLISFLFTSTCFFLALRAASRACAALIAFLTRSVATSGFLLKSKPNALIQWHQLKNELHLYLVSLSFVLQTEVLLLVHVQKR